MKIKGFGVNTRGTDGNFSRLENQLTYLEEAGFEYLEVSADVVDTISGGKIIPKKIDKLLQLLERHKFKYTAHIHNGIDLRDNQDREFQLESFKSSIEFAGIIGAELLVCHFEKESNDPTKESLFREAILKGLEYAKKWKLKIGIENIEIEKFSKVVNFVKEINEPDIILVLDVGHAFLSEHYFGENFFESIKIAASIVGHIHLSDNFGRFEKMRLENFDLYRVSSYTNRLNLGRGDLNLPPGWGTIPFKEVLEILKDYQGIVILEYYHDKYLDFNPDILKETKALFSKYLTR
ncbi:sugar phosphate isomerase/epimerase [bacterium]|nr:sugar phosphate isomerase/epimerase [Candidatus Atribacteria bacterium]MBU4047065.1 sugar phosphate isomerase/epimerase [bacterium]MBU4562951.1 sugar phosphate isomerase/epimerase [bacterium]